MKYSAITLFIFVFFTANLKAQQKDTVVTPSTAKVFGGIGQYNTFSIGVNVGITDGLVPFTINTTNKFKVDLGYGVTLRQQLSHIFSLQLDYLGGKVHGIDKAGTEKFGITEYKTSFNSGAISGVFNIASVSFLHRKNSVNFYTSAGLGLDMYKIKSNTSAGGTVNTLPFGDKNVKELFAPVGAGVKFRLSDALALNLGYTVSFVQGYDFAGVHTYPTFSHYSYTYGGLEYTFGPKSKQNLEWVNPVAQMYDELYDAALRQEVEALKGRVTNVETAVNDLKKDSDGDGVADQFDKCPGTAAGSVVDGSGCVIVFPASPVGSIGIDTPDTGSGTPGVNGAQQNSLTNVKLEADKYLKLIYNYWGNKKQFTNAQKLSNIERYKKLEAEKVDAGNWFGLRDYRLSFYNKLTKK
ncbi:OmpA family protein [Mucilaginibacter sp.]|uniref:OmpA family protein n=1 Tax=Mucilaginibacter sp. TaxID=1882438 RepID=UPI0025E07ABB|nr:OmpA family protein [Mucilaginibacter sp.]